MYAELGSLSKAREWCFLQYVGQASKVGSHADYSVMKHLEDEGYMLDSYYLLWQIGKDLEHYGLVTISGDKNWFRYTITDKGTALLESSAKDSLLQASVKIEPRSLEDMLENPPPRESDVMPLEPKTRKD